MIPAPDAGEIEGDLRLLAAGDAAAAEPGGRDLPLGYFGASTGAAAALVAAAERPEPVRAIVSRGGRPDLAGDALPRVQAPTPLILGSLDKAVIDMSRRAARRMRCECELSIVPGATHLFEEPGALATVLLTDVVDSTAQFAALGDRRWREVLEQHDRIVRAELGRARGREVKTMGDGFLATFDGPARAIGCATAIAQAVRALGIEIRAGLHTGEIEILGDDVGGIAVSIGARVGAMAGLAFTLIGEPNEDGIPVVQDYFGPGMPRVVFEKRLD